MTWTETPLLIGPFVSQRQISFLKFSSRQILRIGREGQTPALKPTGTICSAIQKDLLKSSDITMADRSRSRSPEPSAGDDNAAPGTNGGSAEDAEGVKLYIGNLDYATDEQKLRDEFSAFGSVTEVFLPVERGTNRPRGFGFVTMSTREAAENAISKMDQAQLDGRTIRVNESRPKGSGPRGPGGSGGFNASGKDEVKLYVGNLSFDTTQESIQKLFEQYGTISDCFLPTDRDSGRVRGFAFVTMPAKDAEQAAEKLNGYELDGREIRVNEAQPKGGGGGGGGGGGRYGGGYGDSYGGGYVSLLTRICCLVYLV
jgi:nucleolin